MRITEVQVSGGSSTKISAGENRLTIIGGTFGCRRSEISHQEVSPYLITLGFHSVCRGSPLTVNYWKQLSSGTRHGCFARPIPGRANFSVRECSYRGSTRDFTTDSAGFYNGPPNITRNAMRSGVGQGFSNGRPTEVVLGVGAPQQTDSTSPEGRAQTLRTIEVTTQAPQVATHLVPAPQRRVRGRRRCSEFALDGATCHPQLCRPIVSILMVSAICPQDSDPGDHTMTPGCGTPRFGAELPPKLRVAGVDFALTLTRSTDSVVRLRPTVQPLQGALIGGHLWGCGRDSGFFRFLNRGLSGRVWTGFPPGVGGNRNHKSAHPTPSTGNESTSSQEYFLSDSNITFDRAAGHPKGAVSARNQFCGSAGRPISKARLLFADLREGFA